MVNKLRQKLMVLFLMACIGISGTLGVSALSWSGSTTGGGGEGSAAKTKGFAIRYTDDNNCLGYRFSVVDKNGNRKGSKVIDVFRNTKYGNSEYSAAFKFSTKYSKKQLIANQNNSFSTSKTTVDCFKETTMGFASALPVPSGMNAWQSNHNNLNRVLSALGINGVGALVNGDKVLVEPLQDVRLETIYHSVTVTELAIYGKWLLGANSNGGSSPDSGKWGFISNYTNRHFPNALYTPDGKGLWAGVGALSKRATFYDIINKGYGVGIAYTETKPAFTPALGVNICEAWRGGKSSRTFRYGNSNGASFGNFSYANGYPIKGDSVWFAINFPGESQTVRVRQYARLQGGSWTTRDVNLSESSWYDVALSPTTVDAGRTGYVVEAKQDWIDGSGKVLKSGAIKTFYFPVRPKINRYQVTMYGVTGSVAAKRGAWNSGTLYAGQRVRPDYTYTSDTSWTSSNHFRASLNEWKNGAWRTATSSNGGCDLYLNNTGIRSGGPLARYSSLGWYTVPDNSANTNGANRVPVKLETQWASDPAHTTETTWIDVPIVRSDVELKEIRMIDKSGYYTSTLWTNQTYTPQYVYKNNTGCTVYVEGYNNDRSKISGIYSIPAYGQILVNGKPFVAAASTSQYIWGGVYLEGAGIYNTPYETNHSNNSKGVTFTVKSPLTIEPLAPNSLYREGVQVVSSFRVTNTTGNQYTPSENITVRFKALKNGSPLYSATKATVIPSYGDNLVYFRWTVPTGLNGASITLQGEVLENGKVLHTGSRTHGTEKPAVSQTPDTVFEKTAPPGFRLKSPPVRTSMLNTQWSQWLYNSARGFYKETYGLVLGLAEGTMTPDPDSPSRVYKDGKWHMRSGYGFTLSWPVSVFRADGLKLPPADSYTSVQTAKAYFPEFGYNVSSGAYRVLSSIFTNAFALPANSYAGGDRLHFVPLWFPDGEYTVQCYAGDLWTPTGMMYGCYNPPSVIITESAYDDWYVGK